MKCESELKWIYVHIWNTYSFHLFITFCNIKFCEYYTNCSELTHLTGLKLVFVIFGGRRRCFCLFFSSPNRVGGVNHKIWNLHTPMDTPTSLYASTHTYQCNYPAAALNLARTFHTDIWWWGCRGWGSHLSGNRKSTLGRLLFMRFFCALHSNTENKTTTGTTNTTRTAARTTNGTRKKS